MSTVELNIPKFVVDGKTYPIRIVWKDARFIAAEYDYNILKLFIDEEMTNKVMMALLVDNELVINLCWYFLRDKVEYTQDDLLEYLPTPAHFEEFREAMWAAIVNFSSPQLRGVLVEGWKQTKRQLKALKKELETSTPSSSDSSPEESQSTT